MAKKVMDRLEKAEEKHKKDLDSDDEKGEPAAHRAKVLGKAGKGLKKCPKCKMMHPPTHPHFK